MSNGRIARRSLASPRNRTTDWAAFDATTDDAIRAAVGNDPDAAPLADDAWFDTATVEPAKKESISIRIDRDVLEWFRTHSTRYQTRINAVLRSYMEHQKRRGA